MSTSNNARPGMVLQALGEQYDGFILASGSNDAVDKLRRTLTLRAGMRGTLCALLRQMATDGKIVIEVNGNRFETIALPNATIPTTESEEATMAAPKGMNRTCQPQYADGRILSSRLTNDEVGPVTTTYVSPDVEETVVTTAELAIERLHQAGKIRMGRVEVLGIIVGVVIELHDVQPVLAKPLAEQVFSHLVSHRDLHRDPTSKRNEAVYELRLPATSIEEDKMIDQPPLTQGEAVDQLEQLVKIIETLEKRVVQLTSELETARSTHIDPAILEQLTTSLEVANTTIEKLQRKLLDAEQEKQRIARTHGGELSRLRTQHATELQTLREQLNASEEARRQLETELTGRTREVSPELRARWEKLGITLS